MTMVEQCSKLEEAVRAHLDMVYASALRQMGDAHAAADVTQAVFLILQRKFSKIRNHALLGPWLLRVTRYACLDARKRARRRVFHEQRASAMRSQQAPPETCDVAPVLDEALDQLRAQDRAAIVLAYIEGCSHEEVARRLGIGTEAAHKRVQRAVAKLRRLLRIKGVETGAGAAVAAALRPTAAPAEVMQGVVNCLSGTVPAGVSAILKGTMTMMKILKAQVAAMIFLAAGGLALLGTAALRPVCAQTAGQAAAPAEAAGTSEFAPEATLVIYDESAGHDIFADLDSGNTLTPPPRDPNSSQFWAFGWIERQGVDLAYVSATSAQALVGVDMTIRPMSDTAIDQPDAAYIVRHLLTSTPTTQAVMSVRSLPATFAFRTREGGVGVLQITRKSVQPSSVSVRYRRMTDETRNRIAADTAAHALLPELDELSAKLGAATDPADAQSLAMTIVRAAASLKELVKGSSLNAAAFRRLETEVRMLSERANSGAWEKLDERTKGIQDALTAARAEVAKLQAGG